MITFPPPPVVYKSRVEQIREDIALLDNVIDSALRHHDQLDKPRYLQVAVDAIRLRDELRQKG